MIIDNRPKHHPARKRKPPEDISRPAQDAGPAVHIELESVPPESSALPEAKPVRAKSAPKLLGGSLGKGGGGLLGGLLGKGGSGGLLGGLLGKGGSGGLLGGLLGKGGGGGLLGGGIGGVLPIVLIASVLQSGRGPAFPQSAAQRMPAVPEDGEYGVEAASVSAAALRRGGKRRPADAGTPALPPAEPKPAPQAGPGSGQKRKVRPKAEDREPEPAQQPAAMPEPEAQRPAAPVRRTPQPAEIKGLLADLAGYLPGTGGAQASRIAKIIGLADEMKSINAPGSAVTFAQPADPLDRNIGLLNALGRNLPFAGAEHLGRAGQVLSLVNTIRGGGAGQGLGNMAGMLRTAMSQSQAPSPGGMKNITPEQADGLKSTVNRLLSGMDDKQKDDLLNKAKDFLGKK